MNLITLKQKPIIEFSDMEARGLEVASEIKALNLETIEPTEENRSVMKKIRANLNKELAVFEDQRKMIHGMITRPYKEFTDSYESNIKHLYVNAEKQLKEKISIVEAQMIENKKSDIEAYFSSVNPFPFLSLDNVGLKIILSASDSKLKTQVDEFIEKVRSDVEAIKKMDHQVRIMSLYEKTLDASESIAKVLSDIETEKRIEAEKIERERIAKEEEEKRIKQAQIDAEREAQERVERKRIEAEKLEQQRIQAEKNAKLSKTKEAEEELKRIEQRKQEAEQAEIEAKANQEKLEAEKSKREAEELEAKKVYTMRFTVHGTKAQLKQIKEFLNKIEVNYE